MKSNVLLNEKKEKLLDRQLEKDNCVSFIAMKVPTNFRDKNKIL